MTPRFVLALLLAAASVGTRPVQAKQPTKAPQKQSRALPADHNFDCGSQPAGLLSWNPDGISLPRGVGSKFKLLKSARSAKDTGPAGCKRLPPMSVIVHGANEGNIQRADFVIVEEDVAVYRAFSKSRFECSTESPAQQNGAWWSFERPQQKHDFRTDNAVCRDWNDFSEIVSCTLKAGTVIAVGPTQSVACAQPRTAANCKRPPTNWPGSFKANTHHQIFLNLRGRSQTEIGQFLKNCRVSSWPGRE